MAKLHGCPRDFIAVAENGAPRVVDQSSLVDQTSRKNYPMIFYSFEQRPEKHFFTVLGTKPNIQHVSVSVGDFHFD